MQYEPHMPNIGELAGQIARGIRLGHHRPQQNMYQRARGAWQALYHAGALTGRLGYNTGKYLIQNYPYTSAGTVAGATALINRFRSAPAGGHRTKAPQHNFHGRTYRFRKRRLYRARRRYRKKYYRRY